MDYRCINCQINLFARLLNGYTDEKYQKDIQFKKFLRFVSELNYEKQKSPEMGKIVYDWISDSLKIDDLFREEKEFANQKLLSLESELRNKIMESTNPFDTALRMSIAGNIMDSVASPGKDIISTIDFVLTSQFAIDHSKQLSERINNAKTILYLGDNAGEIVTDKLFIEQLKHNNIYYATRGGVTFNDVTVDDAYSVSMHNVAKVISNGYAAPTTLIDKCSNEFLKVYNEADLIISKGMGNLEGLLNNGNSKIFFLLMVKCNLIAELLKVKKGAFVAFQNNHKN
jgi:uncharacterized protein with ATP-grasp and redox domains